MKKLLSVFFSCIIVLSSCYIVTAYAKDHVILDDFSSVLEMSATDDEAIKDYDEERIKCNATLEDDFRDDSVIVVLKHKTSLEQNNYTETDFSSIGAKSVSDLTEYQTDDIRDEYDKAIERYESQFSNDVSLIEQIRKVNTREFETSKTNEVMSIDAKKIAEKIEKEIDINYHDFHKIIEIKLKEKGKQNVLEAIEDLQMRDDVLVAEPNYKKYPCAIPDDTKYSEQWASKNMSLETAWNTTTGSSNIKIGIMDSGIDKTHADLKANINTSLSKSFLDTSSLIDEDGHGTKVAGVVGAVGNNSKGVAGVCWKISLVSLKIYNGSEGDTSHDLKAISYAISKNIDILNYSYSTKGTSLGIKLKEYNGLFVCSSGNDGKNIDSSNSNYNEVYPSKHTNDNIISVASLKSDNTLASSSNYGTTSVDLAAPGVSIYTTKNDSSNRYGNASGTSFSAPQVAGVAGLIKSKYPTISYKGIKAAILNNVTSVSSLTNKVKTGGKLNANKALSGVATHKFTIKYNKNGGSGTAMSNTSVIYGIPTALRNNKYTKTANHFIGWTAHRSSDDKWLYDVGDSTGWYVEGNQPTGASKHIYSDGTKVMHTSASNGDIVTLYAQWALNTYTIKFKDNIIDAQTMASQIITYSVGQKLRKNTFSYEGYKFKGWFAYRTSDSKWLYTDGETTQWCVEHQQPSGYSKKLYADETTVSKTSSVNNDVIYMYAQWEANQFLIHFNGNGGSGSKQDLSVYSDQSIVLGTGSFTKSGCTFVGWTVVDDDGYWIMNDGSWSTAFNDNNSPKRYESNELVSFKSDEGINLTAYAQWASNSTIVGDVNLNGLLDTNDLTLIQQYIASAVYLTNNQRYAADFNQDGVVNINDASALQRNIATIN